MDEKAYLQGRRQAYLNMLHECLRVLGVDDPAVQHVVWVVERQAAVHTLRDLCEVFGDNDWPDELHLGDVIAKHLGRYLYARIRDGGLKR